MHARAVTLWVVVAAVLSGCAAPGATTQAGGGAEDAASPVPRNMTDLKERLGLAQPPPEPLPPVARAAANVSTTLTGSPVRFSAQESADPEGGALEFAWSFSDGGAASGAVVERAFAAPGEHEARVVVTDVDGLTAEARVLIDVKQANRAPVAVARMFDAEGKPATRARLGAPLTFDASGSSDPDGPFTVDWDFGDGDVSHAPRATHTFDAPGVHVARLVVRDGAGASSEATLRVPVDATFRSSGEVTLAREKARFEFPLGAEAQRVVVTLRFDGALGANDLQVVVRDPGDREMGRSSGETGAGGGPQVRVVQLESDRVRIPGTWAVEVERVSGGTVAWSVEVEQTY